MIETIRQFIPYLFPFVFATAVIEIFLSAIWVPGYFTTGIPIYRRTIILHHGSGRLPAAEQIEVALTASGRRAPMFIRQIVEYRFAFREKLLHIGTCYSPVMRGHITCNPATGEIKVCGYLNWYILTFVSSLILFLLILPFEPANIVIPVCMFVLLSYIYWIQKKRFREVEDAVRMLWTTVQ